MQPRVANQERRQSQSDHRNSEKAVSPTEFESAEPERGGESERHRQSCGPSAHEQTVFEKQPVHRHFRMSDRMLGSRRRLVTFKFGISMASQAAAVIEITAFLMTMPY